MRFTTFVSALLASLISWPIAVNAKFPLKDSKRIDWQPFYTEYTCDPGTLDPPKVLKQDDVKKMILNSKWLSKVADSPSEDHSYGLWRSGNPWVLAGGDPTITIDVLWIGEAGLKKGDPDRIIILKVMVPSSPPMMMYPGLSAIYTALAFIPTTVLGNSIGAAVKYDWRPFYTSYNCQVHPNYYHSRNLTQEAIKRIIGERLGVVIKLDKSSDRHWYGIWLSKYAYQQAPDDQIEAPIEVTWVRGRGLLPLALDRISVLKVTTKFEGNVSTRHTHYEGHGHLVLRFVAAAAAAKSL